MASISLMISYQVDSHWFDVVVVLVAALVLSLLASLYPISRAADLQSAQVLIIH